MRKVSLTIPTMALLVGTRALGAAGIGMLIADRLDSPRRRAIGGTLAAVGVLTTIPLAIEVISSIRDQRQEARAPEREATRPLEFSST